MTSESTEVVEPPAAPVAPEPPRRAPASPPPHWDRFGVAASTVCAVHCAVLPLVLGVLPVLGLGFLAHGAFEWGMVGASALIGSVAFTRGTRVHHRHSVFCLFLGGIGLLLAGLLAFRGACCAAPTLFYGYDALADKLVVLRTLTPPGPSPWRAVLMGAGGLSVATAHFVNLRLCRRCSACRSHVHEPGEERSRR